MTVLDDLTFRRTRRIRAPDGRDRPPTEERWYITTTAKRQDREGRVGYRLRPIGRDHYVRGPRAAMITRCDLRQTFLLNLDDREYVVWPIAEHRFDCSVTERDALAAALRPPIILVQTETVDTGERRTMFDFVARHVLTTRRVLPLPGSMRRPATSIVDGWYIDVEVRMGCEEPASRRVVRHTFLDAHRAGEEPERPTFNDIGEQEHGFCVAATTTSIDRLGENTTEYRQITEEKITDWSTAPIAPAMFDVPRGFRHVDHIRDEPTPPIIVRWQLWWRRKRQRRR